MLPLVINKNTPVKAIRIDQISKREGSVLVAKLNKITMIVGPSDCRMIAVAASPKYTDKKKLDCANKTPTIPYKIIRTTSFLFNHISKTRRPEKQNNTINKIIPDKLILTPTSHSGLIF